MYLTSVGTICIIVWLVSKISDVIIADLLELYEDISHFCGTTDAALLDFWWRATLGF